MRGKLSHPHRTLAGERRTPLERRSSASRPGSTFARWSLAFLAGVALLGTTLACNRVDTDTEAPPSVTRTENHAADSEGPFVWPEDPSHPVLEVSIDAKNARGTILIELMPELAPATVVDIIELANEGFYDGTTFHRVIPGFMIQGGDPNSRDRDPTNDGKGGPGRPLHDEFGAAPFMRGVVGMGNKGREDSTSTQFFIMQADNGNLDGRYTAVGRVLDGMDLVDDIMKVDIDRSGRWGPKDRPIENVTMNRVRTVGQVAAIEQELELRAQAEAGSLLAAAEAHESGAAGTVGPPASPGSNDDWERLEAMGR